MNDMIDAKRLETTEADIFKSIDISLVQRDFVTPYLNLNTREHIPNSKVDIFHGNIVFSSLHQLQFQTTSRRDDIISLCYLIIYLLQDGVMPGIPCNSNNQNPVELL